ncbi:bcl-2-related protein A1 [Eptesicus fuscus]|uniref:bcl-2-related protein A1 n=1 Tax=Eptesicus fuscus TaxID=29078 RepID=UPI002403F160|nr:bcl-2-related protein A1 [Eptesicus fuscus]
MSPAGGPSPALRSGPRAPRSGLRLPPPPPGKELRPGRGGRMAGCEGFGYVQGLAQDYLRHVLRGPRPAARPGRVSRLLRDVASAVQQDAERTLRPYLDGLDVASVEAARAVFLAVVREEFEDGVVNWGRLVTVFALEGILTKKLLRERRAPDRDRDRDDQDLDEDTSEEISHFVAEFITSQAGDWIRQNGGWEHGFVQKFEARPGWPAFLGAAAKVLLCVLGQLH